VKEIGDKLKEKIVNDVEEEVTEFKEVEDG
jgi:hypothetical protein